MKTPSSNGLKGRPQPPLTRMVAALGVACLAIAPLHGAESIDALFANPPAGAHPHTWWHWVNGNVSKEGITLDLEAMHRIGVTGAQIFNVKQCDLTGPISTGSQEWRDLTKFAIQEAHRLGIELTMHNCPGWSESGGPWVPVEQSMQKVVWTETHVKGGQRYNGSLAQPETIQNYYRDIAVLAFPVSAAEESAAATPKTYAISGKGGALTPVTLSAKKPAEFAFSAAKERKSLQIEFATPVMVSSISIQGALQPNKLPLSGALETSEDGKTFHKIAALPAKTMFVDGYVEFPETSAKFFRITVATSGGQTGKLSIADISFAGYRIPNSGVKAGYRPNPDITFSTKPLPPASCIDRKKIIDLTAKLGTDGKLDWEIPAGNWTVLRIGHTTTGKKNAPAPDSGTGLECDKMSRAAVEAHFAGMMGKVLADVGPLAGKSFKMVLADSWEAGCQNWTPAMRQEFTKRRGYDPTPWLPCITGQAIGSLEESERFLWDFRRTIADLIAENHYGTFQQLCHKHNLLFTAEAPGIGMPTIADQLQCKARTDVPMGEFWIDGHNDSREPACAAHIGGQQLATAEAFTARTPDAKWTKTPFDHKALGDLNFSRGINRFVFHRYAMQPWKDRVPGMTMGPWGTNFERTNTWWEQAKPWMDYLARCQALLQSGYFQADVLYLYGEGAPVTLTGHEPKIPAGYGYDAIDAETFLKNLTVKNGSLTLPTGMSYRILLLPPTDRITPAVLRKIKELAAAGATVIGSRPLKSPSLSGYPACDSEIAKLAADLWGAADAASGSHAVGKGRVVWGKPLADVITESGLKPDFETASPNDPCVWIHRRAGDAEIYFVSNQAATSRRFSCTFRVSGKMPELWHPESGKTELAPISREQNGRTTVTLPFDPAGSVFVIFRKQAKATDAIVSATHDGGDAFAPGNDSASLPLPLLELSRSVQGALTAAVTRPGTYEVKTASGKSLRTTVDKLPDPQIIGGTWSLRFPPKWGAPDQVNLDTLISWPDHADEGVRHFSGTATYMKEFDWQNALPHARYYLDLGVVKELAQVRLNGKDLGILWMPPFRVDITDALKAGKNNLEVRVTNLWPNRLIGDAALPEAKRLTWTTFQPYKPQDRLLPSGLLGPVKIQAQARAELR